MVDELKEFIFINRIPFCQAGYVNNPVERNFVVLEVLKDLLSELEPICHFVKSWNIQNSKPNLFVIYSVGNTLVKFHILCYLIETVCNRYRGVPRQQF